MKTPFFITIFLISNFHLLAQWESMHGPFGSTINDLGQNDHYVFAATTAGIYRSADTGLTWTHKSFIADTRFPCLQFDVFDSLLIADAVEIRPDTVIRRMYKSVDEGETWIEIPRPMVDIFLEIAVVGNTIFANDQENIWITQNDGLQWKHSNVNHSISIIGCFERFGSNVYVGSFEDLFVYEGHDNNWKKITIPMAYTTSSIFVKDSLMLVRDYSKEDLYISEDSGVTWFSSPGNQWNSSPNYFATIGDTIYSTGYETIYVSVDRGHTWEARDSKGLDYYCLSLITVDSVLLLGHAYWGIYGSHDFGREFHFSSQGIDAAYVEKLFLYNNQLLTGGTLQGVFNFDYQAGQWQRTYYDEYVSRPCFDLEEYKGKLVMADIEVRWYEPSSGEWITNTPENAGVYTDLFISPYGLIAGGNRGGLLGPLSVFTEMEYWDDSYFQIGNGLPYLFAQNTEYQFIADWNRIARSNIGGQHWEWMNSFTDTNTYILDMITIEDAIYVIQTEGPYQHNRLYVSYDYGTSWAKADLGIPIEDSDTGPQRLIEVGDFLLCCTQGYKSGVYFSRKDQILWQKWNDGLPYLNVKDVISDGEYIYAAVTSQGVWKRKIDEIKITNTQDEESIHVSSMELYPNPTNGQFYIHLDADDLIGARLKMYDLQGKVILEKIISDLNSAIETGGLPNGLYGVELKTNTNCYATKLIVQY